MYNFTFILTRKTGKAKTLKAGNQMISANDRYHFAVKMKLTEFLRSLACQKVASEFHLTAPVFTPDNPCTVIITIHPPTRRRMDPPNWYPTVKALIDGMTDAKLWSDDNHEIIRALTFVYGEVTEDKKYHLDFKIEKM